MTQATQTQSTSFHLAGRRVLITGASRGLGRALAFSLGAAGAELYLVARNAEALGDIVRQLRAKGIDAHSIAGDVTGSSDAIAARYAALVDAGAAPSQQHLDVLIHNAGSLGTESLVPLGDTSPEALARAFEVNAFAPLRLTRAFLPWLLASEAPLVVGVTSDAALESYPGWGPYGASKVALEHILATYAAEHPALRVLRFDPSEMETAMLRAAMPDADPSTLADPTEVASDVPDILGRVLMQEPGKAWRMRRGEVLR